MVDYVEAGVSGAVGVDMDELGTDPVGNTLHIFADNSL